LLLVDVDGVFSLFGLEAATPPPGRLALMMVCRICGPSKPRTAESAARGIRQCLLTTDPDAGTSLIVARAV